MATYEGLTGLGIESSEEELREAIRKAVEETTIDWSSHSVWDVLAKTKEDPYGVKSKQGLRRLERQIRKRRPVKGKKLDGTRRKKRADEIRKAHNDYWKNVRSSSRAERLKTDPVYKHHSMSRMAKNWGLDWTIPVEEIARLMDSVVKDPRDRRKKPLKELTCKWQLRRIDPAAGWHVDNIKIHIVKPKRRKKGKRLLRSKSKLPYNKQKGLGYIKPAKEKKDEDFGSKQESPDVQGL